jgi:hypothetical protein
MSMMGEEHEHQDHEKNAQKNQNSTGNSPLHWASEINGSSPHHIHCWLKQQRTLVLFALDFGICWR